MDTNHFVDQYSKDIFEEHDKTMNPQWKSIYKSLPLCDVDIHKNTDKNLYVVQGTLKHDMFLFALHNEVQLSYAAANSPTYNSSFSGSGLPYPNESVAFSGGENIGYTPIIQGKFSFKIQYPNSYYTNLGKDLVPPQVKIRVCLRDSNAIVSDVQIINLGENIPFRTLSYPNQRNYLNGPFFYDNRKMPVVRSQYEILLSSAYPHKNVTPPNFWGEKPPF